ncbi:MAG TPA: sigma 54-interacting transcriptional regulator [Vicinamibacteria bacterium]|nr:sigma 54-interacting transcriptional regulator [Vicinamibacteria bacterium]
MNSIERVAVLLSRHLPADFVAVRRVNLQRQQMETIAVGSCRGGKIRPEDSRTTSCSNAQIQNILDWCAAGQIRRGDSDEELLRVLALPGGWRSVLAGPLTPSDGGYGVFAVHSEEAEAFSAAHETLVLDLLEPVSVALGNDTRLHELARLRESLEADKRALLSRLGREEIVDTIVGASAGLQEVMERVSQVAPTDAPVLLLGETGTGKELVARAIHTRSRRAAGPIMRVNCGALPPGLIDSELFGHERGSFTGAIAARKGWFERADGGTLFLDEVGELSLEAQVRLLRILQDGTFERVGSHRGLTVDVRIVAATNRDLREMVTTGTFREDLWYRIGVFPIWIPPLRERREDVPALATHFAARTGVRLGGARLVPSPSDIELLLGYDWPGNIREFAAVIERAAILGDAKCLRLEAALGAPQPSAKTRVPREADAPAEHVPRESATRLDQAMARHIEQALLECRGRIEGPFGAAGRLGINPHTLRARMRKLGIDWRRFRAR